MVDLMVSMLEREMYTEAEAARLLRVHQSTLHYWLEGGTRRRKTYKPIIRPEPRGVRRVTWAEFVESGWLREYRSANRGHQRSLRAPPRGGRRGHHCRRRDGARGRRPRRVGR